MADSTSYRVAKAPRYRSAVQASNAIREHCHVYFDEKLYVNALTLLSDIVSCGASQPVSHPKPVLVPAPEHIAIICSLLVHPEYTTTNPTDNDRCIPALALTLLRDLLSIAGPLNANFEEAFAFPEANTRASRLEVNYRDGNIDTFDSPRIKGAAAQHGLWKSAKDVWHVVGWAFNCSVCYPKRWKYWKVCLEFLLDVLETDWKERERLDQEEYEVRKAKDPKATMKYTLLAKSLLMQYLAKCEDVSGEVKRVVKAVFAEGSDDSLRLFPEIFADEVRDRDPKGRHKRKRDDFNNLPYAEYDSDGVFGSSPSRSSPAPSQNTSDEPIMMPFGDPEALKLRQRVLALLSQVAYVVPDSFTNISTLYDLYWNVFKPMPIAAFSKFISPSKSNPVPGPALISISLLGCSRLISHQAVSKQGFSKHFDDAVTQEILEKLYFPYAANTSSADDNAKLAVLIENLFRHIVTKCEYTPTLKDAIQKGIVARERQVKTGKRRKDGVDRGDDEEAIMWMKAAGQRLISMANWLDAKAEVNTGG